MSRCRECESAFVVSRLFLSLFSPFRSIPQAGYVKVGSLRYGIRISNLNLSNYPRSNKPQALSSSTPSSLIMSPSSGTISAKAICNDGCCCIGSTSSKTRLPMSQSGEREKKKHFGNCPTPTRPIYVLFFREFNFKHDDVVSSLCFFFVVTRELPVIHSVLKTK